MCVGVFPIVSKISTSIAPFVVDLGGEVHPGLPPGIFGALMVTSAVTFFILPETKNEPLKQSIEELQFNKTKTLS